MVKFYELTQTERSALKAEMAARVDRMAERLEDLVMEAAVMLPEDEYVDVFVGLITRLTNHVGSARAGLVR